jgi:acyl carrier protein
MGMTMTDDCSPRIREVLAAHARLPVAVTDLGDDDDLFQAGMTSHASVNVMLALEDAFDVEFPEAMLRKSTFASIGALRAALHDLLSEEVTA